MTINNSQYSDKKSVEAWWQPAVSLFLRFSAWIAFPVIFGSYLGKWLDDKYDSAPWGFLGIVGASFTISMVGLIVNAAKEYAKIEKNSKK